MAQTLKPETREAILRSARKAFLAQGFPKASLRAIAADAGVSTSNLYTYFPNKAELFAALVDPVYRELRATGQLMARDSKGDWKSDAFVESFVDELSTVLGGLLAAHGSEVVLLLAASEGTKHAPYRKQMEARLARTFADDIALGSGGRTADPAVAALLAAIFVEGMVQIVRASAAPAEIARRARDLMRYHVAGLRALMR
jgi:AcrR family transcriptional regulator